MVIKPKGVWKWKFISFVLGSALLFTSYQSITLTIEQSTLKAEVAMAKAEVLQYQLVYGKLNGDESDMLTQTKAWFNETFSMEDQEEEKSSFNFQSMYETAFEWCGKAYGWLTSLVD